MKKPNLTKAFSVMISALFLTPLAYTMTGTGYVQATKMNVDFRYPMMITMQVSELEGKISANYNANISVDRFIEMCVIWNDKIPLLRADVAAAPLTDINRSRLNNLLNEAVSKLNDAIARAQTAQGYGMAAMANFSDAIAKVKAKQIAYKGAIDAGNNNVTVANSWASKALQSFNGAMGNIMTVQSALATARTTPTTTSSPMPMMPVMQ
jgi:hypothetical protein